MQDQSLARFIDQTLLKPEATPAQILKLCAEAKQHQFYGVCVNSSYVELVAQELKGSNVHTVAVIGFPLGAMCTAAKVFETQECVRFGAQEIDMVQALGRLKAKDYDYVRNDIAAVVKAAGNAKVKVIIETSLLDEEEKRISCRLAVEAGAHFVKTSTGFNGGGATVADVRLMREVVGSQVGVKASGGVKSKEQAQAVIEAGANRIGTSSGVELVSGQTIQGGY